MAGVDFTRQELVNQFNDYRRVNDCCAGQSAIKAGREFYLPKPNIENPDKVAVENRYLAYLSRAVFYGFAGRTLVGLTGLVFSIPPVIETPKLTGIIIKNADGSGVSIEGQAKVAVEEVTKLGRCGLFVDYPETNGDATTRAQIENGDIQPVILLYKATQVINWDTGVKGGKTYITLVVLKEQFTVPTTGEDFETKVKDQYRVLELVNGSGQRISGRFTGPSYYRQTIYRPNAVNKFEPQVPVSPTDSKGQLLSEIPFTFIGAISNNAEIDKPPLIDIAHVNIAHYNNSAEFEDSCYLVGQPQPFMTGLDQEWVNENFKNKEFVLGSRVTIPLPKDAMFHLEQAQPNTLAESGMERKEKQLIALGAKLIEETGPAKTAQEAASDQLAENCVLATIANNVSAAFKFGLEWCAIFIGELQQDRDPLDNSIVFQLNTKYDSNGMSAADRQQLLAEWLADAISFSEYRNNLRTVGIALDEDADAKKEIKGEQSDQIDFEKERNKALAASGVGNQPGNTPGTKKTSSGSAA